MPNFPDSILRLAAKQDPRVRAALGQIADGAEALHRALTDLGAETPQLKDALPLIGPDMAARAAHRGYVRTTPTSGGAPMSTQPDTLAAIRARPEASTHPYWRGTSDIGTLLALLEDAHCRLHLIWQRTDGVDVRDDPTGITGDIGPWLDGPLHPTHLAAYRAHTARQES